jgi:hypothetical protein
MASIMQTKTTQYATTANIGTNNSSLLCSLPVSSYDSRPLSGKENEILKTLCETEGKSIWAQQVRRVCREVIQTGDNQMFRDLLKSLVSQGKDNPELLKNILGVKAFTVLSHNSSWLNTD